MNYRLLPLAERDIAAIAEFTFDRFGTQQADRYEAAIVKALSGIGANPELPGSRARNELGAGTRAYHLELTIGRRGAAAHIIYYSSQRDPEGHVPILRVLHQSMDPTLHLTDDPQ